MGGFKTQGSLYRQVFCKPFALEIHVSCIEYLWTFVVAFVMGFIWVLPLRSLCTLDIFIKSFFKIAIN